MILKNLKPFQQQESTELIDTGMERMRSQQERMKDLIKFPTDKTGKTITPPPRMDLTHKVRKKTGRSSTYTIKSYESFEVTKYAGDPPAPFEYRRVVKDPKGNIVSDEIIDAKSAFGQIRDSVNEILKRESAHNGNPMTELGIQ